MSGSWGVENADVLARVREEKPATLAELEAIAGPSRFDPGFPEALTDAGWVLGPVQLADVFGARHPETGAYIVYHEGLISYEVEGEHR